jgi:hypothetical protein
MSLGLQQLKDRIIKYDRLIKEIKIYFIEISNYQQNPSFLGGLFYNSKVNKTKNKINEMKTLHDEIMKSQNILALIYTPEQYQKIISIYKQSFDEVNNLNKKYLSRETDKVNSKQSKENVYGSYVDTGELDLT